MGGVCATCSGSCRIHGLVLLVVASIHVRNQPADSIIAGPFHYPLLSRRTCYESIHFSASPGATHALCPRRLDRPCPDTQCAKPTDLHHSLSQSPRPLAVSLRIHTPSHHLDVSRRCRRRSQLARRRHPGLEFHSLPVCHVLWRPRGALLRPGQPRVPRSG